MEKLSYKSISRNLRPQPEWPGSLRPLALPGAQGTRSGEGERKRTRLLVSFSPSTCIARAPPPADPAWEGVPLAEAKPKPLAATPLAGAAAAEDDDADDEEEPVAKPTASASAFSTAGAEGAAGEATSLGLDGAVDE